MGLIVNQFSLQIEVIHLATDFQILSLNLNQCRQKSHKQRILFMTPMYVHGYDSHQWVSFDTVKKEKGNQSMFHKFSLYRFICTNSKHMILGLCWLEQYLKMLHLETMFPIKIIEYRCHLALTTFVILAQKNHTLIIYSSCSLLQCTFSEKTTYNKKDKKVQLHKMLPLGIA